MEGYKQPPEKEGARLVNSIWSKPAVKFGFTFVLGVFIGFMIFSFIVADYSGGTSETDAMKGTFYGTGSSGNMKTADVLQYDSPVANAMFRVRYTSKLIEIEADLNSPDPVKCSIQFDYNDFAVLNVQNISVNDQTTAMAAGNFIQISNTGENRFLIHLQNKSSMPNNLDFKIFQNDSPVFQNSVQVNKE